MCHVVRRLLHQPPILSLINMTHHIHVKTTLGCLNLDVQASFNNEIVAISGDNGAGKTSLLRCIAGLEQAQGRIQINQHIWLDDAISLATSQRNIGFVWSSSNLLPWLNVKQNIQLGHPKHGDMPRLWDDFQLTHLLEKKPAMLSTGESQRVALARAIYQQPSLLLLDEPFSAQAPAIRHHLRKALQTWQQRLDIPLLMVSHEAEDGQVLAQQHWQIHEGQLNQPKS